MSEQHQREIYRSQADRYEELVSREDYRGHILPALQQIRPLAGLDVIELGAGTGRLTALLAPLAGSLRVFDRSGPMLALAREKLRARGHPDWLAALADHRRLPLASGIADLVVAGWSVCYLVVGYEKSWWGELTQALAEMKRVLRPDGTIIILETLGTGFERPTPPDKLRDYYDYLETEAGFNRTWIRTDYRFVSLIEAENLTRFFFGEVLAQQVAEKQWRILPECTGLWWLSLPG